MQCLYILLTTFICFVYINFMEKKSAQIYTSTYKSILQHKGDRSIATYIDDAVNYYIMTRGKGSELARINENIAALKETQKTILGVNCEVLQAGILNGNGEIDFLKLK